jgi:hypothetical protein
MLEQSLGSTSFALLMATLAVGTNLLFLALAFLGYLVMGSGVRARPPTCNNSSSSFLSHPTRTPYTHTRRPARQALFMMAGSFWLVVLGLITVDCLQNPEATRQVRNKVYYRPLSPRSCRAHIHPSVRPSI